MDEFPPIAPGAYAAPPRSGVTMGAQRGGQLGGLRVRFPELVIGLPQLEWTGRSNFSRASHMRLDEAVAPYVANPHYEAALVAREMERRQWMMLEDEQRARQERAARDQQRSGEEEDELARLREREQFLRQQLAEMQHQLKLLHARLPPEGGRSECIPVPHPARPQPLPCPPPEVRPQPTAIPATPHAGVNLYRLPAPNPAELPSHSPQLASGNASQFPSHPRHPMATQASHLEPSWYSRDR